MCDTENRHGNERCEVILMLAACDLFVVVFSVHLENHEISEGASELKPQVNLSDIHYFLNRQK